MVGVAVRWGLNKRADPNTNSLQAGCLRLTGCIIHKNPPNFTPISPSPPPSISGSLSSAYTRRAYVPLLQQYLKIIWHDCVFPWQPGQCLKQFPHFLSTYVITSHDYSSETEEMSGGKCFFPHSDLRCDHAALQVIFTDITTVSAHYHGVIHKETAEELHIHHT